MRELRRQGMGTAQLFSSLALVVLNFPSRKLPTFRSFPEESCELVVASLEKVLKLESQSQVFRGRRYGDTQVISTFAGLMTMSGGTPC